MKTNAASVAATANNMNYVTSVLNWSLRYWGEHVSQPKHFAPCSPEGARVFRVCACCLFCDVLQYLKRVLRGRRPVNDERLHSKGYAVTWAPVIEATVYSSYGKSTGIKIVAFCEVWRRNESHAVIVPTDGPMVPASQVVRGLVVVNNSPQGQPRGGSRLGSGGFMYCFP